MSAEQQAPQNPIYPWLRVMLWLLPTGFLILSVAGFFAMQNSSYVNGNLLLPASVALNLLFVMGAGWCDYKLSPPTRKLYRTAAMAICLFFICQVFVVPILMGALAFALCSFAR